MNENLLNMPFYVDYILQYVSFLIMLHHIGNQQENTINVTNALHFNWNLMVKTFDRDVKLLIEHKFVSIAELIKRMFFF